MKLAIGTVQFGLNYGIANRSGQVNQREARSILGYAKAHGIDTLDTAITYGDCETRLGEIGVTGWQVISKLPALPVHVQDVETWVRAQVQASLARLRMSCLRGFLLHRPEQLLGKHGDEIYCALSALKRQGLIEKIGVSIYNPGELDPLVRRFNLDLVQAPFNILDRRLITSGWMDRLARMNIELHARSVFLQGLLLMPNTRRPDKFNRWQPIWQRWQRWLAETGLTPLQACLRDALRQTGIARVVVGVDSLAQLEEILRAAEGPAPDLPEALHTNEIDLIDPARWEKHTTQTRNIVAIIQARMSSSRLPGKVLMPLAGKPVLEHVVSRIRACKTVGNVVIATSTDRTDDAIQAWCETEGISHYRGSLDDVLDRYYQAAMIHKADAVVRITADCPAVDPTIVDDVVKGFLAGGYDYYGLSGEFPDGLDCTVFSFAALERAWHEAKLKSEREHVGPYVEKHPELFKIGGYKKFSGLSCHRWTLDEPRDYEFLQAVFARLYQEGAPFLTAEVLALLDREPELMAINSNIVRNEGYLKSLAEDRKENVQP
ncbi:MAG: hypothetical protein A3H35_11875 [Betaproteobacteria bacterium RIFCSPLOWO2_02_FULL_62_17]|nr:MAG: hypothetical protein A3H35_11875 [Betaproteobacteria bacterium RIFCSPLOWO2_02_FULL_62_17]